MPHGPGCGALAPALRHAPSVNGDLDVLETLAAVAPVHAVRGNIDVLQA